MLSWKIAARYFFSKKSHNAVNIISAISVVGVAVATAAIIIVLSVFNGFSDVAASHLAILDPEVKVSPATGKVIEEADNLAAALSLLPGVQSAVPVVQERALAVYDNRQMPVIFKGIPTGYDRVSALDSVMVDGRLTDSVAFMPAAQLSAGVAVRLGAMPSTARALELYVPRRTGRINAANPSASFVGEELLVSGVFQIGQSEYDTEYVYVPIELARDMLEYDTEATAVELRLQPGANAEAQAALLARELGAAYKVETRLQQQEESFRMIRIEKWVTFLMLAFILVIASFNIISTLSLMVIEKRANMLTLRAVGAPRSLVRRIFVMQGWLISAIGGLAGILLGTALALAQQYFKLIRLNGDPSHFTIDAYPVRVDPCDVLIVFALVLVVGFATSQITRVFTRRI